MPDTRTQRSAYGSSGPPTHVRLVRIYLPFSNGSAAADSTTFNAQSSDAPPHGAPFVQLALETGDTSVSLGQLKLDVFAALASSLHVLQAKQSRGNAGMKSSGSGGSTLSSSGRIDLGDSAAPVLVGDGENLRESVVGALPVFSSGGGGGSFSSSRHSGMGTSLARSSSYSSRSWSEARSIGTVSSEDSDLQQQQQQQQQLQQPSSSSSSSAVNSSGGGRRRLGSLGPGEGTAEGGEAYFHASAVAAAAAAAADSTSPAPLVAAPTPEEVLRSANEAAERALAAKAAAVRRVPLPPRQRIRGWSTAGVAERGIGGGGGDTRRRSSADASNQADETAACQPSPELAEAMQRLQRGLPEVGPRVNPNAATAAGSSTSDSTSTSSSGSSAEQGSTIQSPTPWATAASWVEWGRSGAGASLATTMLAKGPSAFVWRAVRQSPINPSADLSLAEGWLWRRSGSSTAAGADTATGAASTAGAAAARPSMEEDGGAESMRESNAIRGSSLADSGDDGETDVRSTRFNRPSFFRSNSLSSRPGGSSSGSRPSSKSPPRTTSGLERSTSFGSVGSPATTSTRGGNSASGGGGGGEGKWKRRYYALSESPDGSGPVFAVYKDAAKATV